MISLLSSVLCMCDPVLFYGIPTAKPSHDKLIYFFKVSDNLVPEKYWMEYEDKAGITQCE